MPTFTTNYNLAKPLVNDATDQDLWGGELNDDMDIIDSTMKSISDAAGPMIGSGFDWFGSTAPIQSGKEYVFAYGQAISRTTYATCFAVMGTTYGAGDGSTTFNLPDKRGRVSAGKDDMGGSSANRLTGLPEGVDGDVLGAAGGLESNTLTIAQMPAHDHTGSDVASKFSGASPVGANLGASAVYIQNGTIASQGGGGAHNNVQPTLICNYVIRIL